VVLKSEFLSHQDCDLLKSYELNSSDFYIGRIRILYPMTEVTPDTEERTALSGNAKRPDKGGIISYEKSSPIYSLLSGKRVGQIPIDEHKEIDREELLGYQKIVSCIQWIVLVLVGLTSKMAFLTVQNPPLFYGVFSAFALLSGLGIYRWYGKAHGVPHHLRFNIWVLFLFITISIWQTGSLVSPLLPLYLVSISLTGITLGSQAVLLQALLISACYLFFILLSGLTRTDQEILFLFNSKFFALPLLQLAILWLLACALTLLAKEIEIAKDKIRQLSRTDQLTGLWNMQMLLIFMQREYQRTLTRDGKFSVLMIDADGLKGVNDALGHHAGTVLIVSISETMRMELREEDMLARFGGDEFVAFLPDTSCNEAYRIAERMRIRISELPIHYEGHSITITVSCGVACFPEHGDDLREIMKKADRALYSSKNNGKNKSTIFQSPDDAEAI
jgi:diguanylate cyclase (GGDEF)-like protein